MRSEEGLARLRQQDPDVKGEHCASHFSPFTAPFFFMRIVLFASFFLLSAILPAQRMLKTGAWCSDRHATVMPPPGPDFRSDSIDILHTRIELDVATPPQISGKGLLTIQSKVALVNQIRLDLEALEVDSVQLDGLSAGFWQSGPTLTIDFPSGLTESDTVILGIWYHGTPVTDESGWGGVYNQSGYFYNLGVGFAADPHSFGRAWFPCFDNFVERCSFEFVIVSTPARPAYCNGALTAETSLPNGTVQRTWQLNEQIPSYLACFATGPYTTFQRSYPGVNGPIPVEIAAAPADTANVALSFQHLPQAIAAFENWFGPYRWNKIGYSLVPFNAGAMEHATNVAIMRSAIDGTLNMETLWAHELSHHWWGDLATCTTAEDMWLNEGWAAYSEHLFTEAVYGEAAYLTAVQNNFLPVLERTHVDEDGYRAVSGLPHEWTYGDHVYKKGAVVAHNLRTYLGDSLFRVGIRTALENTQFDDWSSADFRDKLTDATGQDMTRFFDDWVFAPGFTHFAADSFQVEFVGNQYHVTVFIKQKSRGAPHLYQQVPLECTFVDAAGIRTYRTGTASGESSSLEFDLPFLPKYVWVNTRLKLTLARADQERKVGATGLHSFSPAKMDVNVVAIQDSVFLRVEHHFAMPDTGAIANPYGYKLTNRYWSVVGDFPEEFDANGQIFYDGRGAMDQLDHELFEQTSPSEDSLLLIYRTGPGQFWQEYPDYFKNPLGSTNNRHGFIRINHLVPGEYTFAKGVSTVSSQEPVRNTFSVNVRPNPARQILKVQASEAFYAASLYAADGTLAQSWQFDSIQQAELKLNALAPGHYWLVLTGKKSSVTSAVTILK